MIKTLHALKEKVNQRKPFKLKISNATYKSKIKGNFIMNQPAYIFAPLL